MTTTKTDTTITEKEVKLYGVMNMTSIINNERHKHYNNTEKLFSIIERLGNEEALREAYKVVEIQLLINFSGILYLSFKDVS
jgi:hypothetical protein